MMNEKSSIIEKAMKFDMSDVLKRYCDEQDLPLKVAKEHEQELKRFLALSAINQRSKESPFAMRGPIDELWHTFVIFTKTYAEFCESIAGGMIHHMPNTTIPRKPTYTKREPGWDELPVAKLVEGYLKYLSTYEKTFGTEAPAHLWPRPNREEASGYTSAGCGCGCGCGCSCIA